MKRRDKTHGRKLQTNYEEKKLFKLKNLRRQTNIKKKMTTEGNIINIGLERQKKK